jgi:hypothetical protein
MSITFVARQATTCDKIEGIEVDMVNGNAVTILDRVRRKKHSGELIGAGRARMEVGEHTICSQSVGYDVRMWRSPPRSG